MTLHVGVGGVWKDIAQRGWSFGKDGVWTRVEQAWVGVGGSWKEFYKAGVDLNWTGFSIDLNPEWIAGNGSGLLVATNDVNPGGTAQPRYSTDNGETWATGSTTMAINASGSGLTHLAYINGYFFVLSGYRGTVDNFWYSTNGNTWTAGRAHTGATPYCTPSRVAYGNGTYAMLSTNNYVFRSTNLTSWARTASAAYAGADLQFINGRFIIPSSTVLYESTDAATWTTRTHGVAGGLNVAGRRASIIWDGTYYFAIGVQGIFRSTNLTSWTKVFGSGTASHGFRGIDRDPISGLIIAMSDIDANKVYSEDAGATWVNYAAPTSIASSRTIFRDGSYWFYGPSLASNYKVYRATG
jgi:hypothetical protein